MNEINSLKTPYHTIVLTIAFIILPLIDAVNGFFVVRGYLSEAGVASPSQLGRFLFISLLIFLSISNNLTKAPFYLVAYLVIIELVATFMHQSSYGLVYGLISSYKLFYFFIFSVIITEILRHKLGKELLSKYLFYNLVIISSLLYFSTITGIGNSTYGFGFGTKSFFASGNGLGLYLGVSSLILIALYKQKQIQISFAWLIFISVSIALIGSKTALFLCLINLFVLVLISEYKKSIFIFSFFLGVWLIPYLIDMLSVVFDVIYIRLINSDSIFSYLGSGRIQYVSDAFETYFSTESNWIRFVFGAGAFISFQNPSKVSNFDTLESDLFDLLFMYGAVSVTLIFILSILIVIKLKNNSILLFGFLLLLLHSLIAGHVIFNGMSSVAFAIFIALAFSKNKSEGSGFEDNY